MAKSWIAPAVRPAAAIILTIIIVSAIARTTPTRNPPAQQLDVAYWDWGAVSALSAEDQSRLHNLNCQTIYSFMGTIGFQVGRFTWTRQGPSLSVPVGFTRHIVIRFDRDVAGVIGRSDLSGLETLVLDRFARMKDGPVAGLQIDADVPTSRLLDYGKFLTRIRQQLPPVAQLSVTMLLDWTNNPHLAEAMQSVHLVIPQFYATKLANPAQTDNFVFGGNLERVINVLERGNIPYRIGLPVYEQSHHFQGQRCNAIMPVSMEGLLSADGHIQRIVHGNEDIVDFRFDEAVLVDAVRIGVGDLVIVSRPSVAGLSDAFRRSRASAGPSCQGFAIFRLPDQKVSGVLSLDQVTAAYRGAWNPPKLTAEISVIGDECSVKITNSGDIDWFQPDEPATWNLEGLETVREIPATNDGFTLIPARNNAPTSWARANGWIIACQMLRAGDTMTLTGLGHCSSVPTLTTRQ